MRILRGDGPPIQIGHRGAASLAPENTLDALRAGIAERLRVRRVRRALDTGGELVLAHSRHEVPGDVATFDEALELLRPRDVGAHVDLKQRGLEEACRGLRCGATASSSARW